MIAILDDPLPTSARWADLVEELDCWGAQGRIATLWWRDDDAVAPSRQLDDLVSVAGGIPVALAVIPALAEPALVDWLEKNAPASWRVLQHGWRHADHSADKKSEFPVSRPTPQAMMDLARGRQCLIEMFEGRALTVLAPPWNRFEEAFLPLLAEAGIAGISRIKPRQAAFAHPGIFQVNIHVDLIAWHGERGFVGEGPALGGLIHHLRARRCGRADADEPTGILTHHLVQDEATGVFLRGLACLTREHPAALWLDAGAVFAPTLPAMPSRGRA